MKLICSVRKVQVTSANIVFSICTGDLLSKCTHGHLLASH